MSKIINKPGIVVAFDMENRLEAVELARKLRYADGNFVIKIGRPLEMKYSMAIISMISAITDVPIIYDGKIADIPYISAKIAEYAYNAGANAVIAHSFVGDDVIQAIVDLNMGDVIAVVEMSHPGWQALHRREWETASRISRMDIDGIVLPATNPQSIRGIRQMLDPDTYIISPGIGAQGANTGSAFEAGASYEIIGRQIYEDRNPVDMAEYCYGWGLYWEREREWNR